MTVEAALAGLLLIIARECGSGAPQAVLTRVAGAACFGVLLNLCPLLQLDGYWLLADALDMPDLEQRSKRALRNLRRSTPHTTAGSALAAYRVLSLGFGIAVLIGAAFVWRTVFGVLVVALWHAGLWQQLLAVALVAPAAGLLLQLLAILRPRRQS
jgi:putative peptide zinc metalloprotease protein